MAKVNRIFKDYVRIAHEVVLNFSAPKKAVFASDYRILVYFSPLHPINEGISFLAQY